MTSLQPENSDKAIGSLDGAGAVTMTSRTDSDIGRGPVFHTRSTRASTLACSYSAGAAATRRTSTSVQPPDPRVSSREVKGMDEVECLIGTFRARATRGAASRLDVLMDLDQLRDARIVPFLVGS